MSKINNDTYSSSKFDDLFLNYNGFGNINKSTIHVIKNKKNEIKLCDLNSSCIKIEFDIKNKNIFSGNIDIFNSNNDLNDIFNVQVINIEENDVYNTDSDNDTETITDSNNNSNNCNISIKNNSSKNNNDNQSYYVKNKYENFQEISLKDNTDLNLSTSDNLKKYSEDFIQELLNYHTLVVLFILILLIYFLRK